MSSFTRLAPVLLLVLAPAVSACGGDSDNTTDDAAPPPSSTPSAPSTSSPTASDTSASSSAPADGALPAACDVLAPTDVQAAFGVEFGPGEPGGGGTTEDDLEWSSDNCDWEASDLVEVQLAVTGPDDFTGELTCPEPTSVASTVEPVPDLGEAAYWEVDDSPPLEATLRVCTAGYNVDIDLEHEDGTDVQGDPLQQSIALATVVLAKLG